ncbi:hypothetical protein [Thiohalomonas denitrificans]|uniref:hypothetical protein n=1 Tax=Thiohalomonas denitrificans TaxID=415747 RepID=UPI0026F27923|nr:hypothetical protein [Thiohalomonas denitrificans]
MSSGNRYKRRQTKHELRRAKACVIKEPLGPDEVEGAIQAEDKVADRFNEPASSLKKRRR